MARYLQLFSKIPTELSWVCPRNGKITSHRNCSPFHPQVDCSAFGQLVQVLEVTSMPYPQREVIESECLNLRTYIDRIKGEMWPDWSVLTHDGEFQWLSHPSENRCMGNQRYCCDPWCYMMMKNSFLWYVYPFPACLISFYFLTTQCSQWFEPAVVTFHCFVGCCDDRIHNCSRCNMLTTFDGTLNIVITCFMSA